mmetsp:Transcript_62772/g.177044  ORF Transcript_62772/g.177044 Transcript_62772/m.177044 type:complete len:442 (-) Transcript_62772:29-1354(-)
MDFKLGARLATKFTESRAGGSTATPSPVAATEEPHSRAADGRGGHWGNPGPMASAVLGGWDTLGEAVGIAPGSPAAQRFRETNCFPAAVVWSLLQLPASAPPPPRNKPVVVWIVGARDIMEGQLALDGNWCLLADVFPELQWELVLVGPEMEGLGSAVPADGGRGRVFARGVCLKGHELARERAEPPPSFAVCFNSGVGTLALPLVRHWLETLEELLRLGMPVLFTCFSEKEKKGEDFIIREMFKARVLVDFMENPLRPEAGDKLVGYQKKAGVPSSIDEIERDDDTRICNTFVWWAHGSLLSSSELCEVATVNCPQTLKGLCQTFALKGAYKGWLASLNKGDKGVGAIALESFSAALENPAVAKVFAKLAKLVIGAIVQYTRRHGLHPDARPCVERIMVAKVRIQLGDGIDEADVLETVNQAIDDEHGSLLPRGGCLPDM